MAPRSGGSGVLSSWWELCFVVVVYWHAGQPRDSSPSMYSRSAMVVISFLSILGNSRLMRRSSCPSSFVTWYSSVRVLILSLFITCSSRFSLYTSQLSWQGMTGEFGVACRVFCCVTVFLGRILICGHWYRRPVLGGVISCSFVTLNFEKYKWRVRHWNLVSLGVSIGLCTLVGFDSGSGHRWYWPCPRNFSYSAYRASPACQGCLGFCLFFLPPLWGSPSWGHLFSLFEARDIAVGSVGKSFSSIAFDFLFGGLMSCTRRSD